jgi:hypothetical protein
MKKYLPISLLLLGILLASGLQSCNSKKNAAEKEERIRQEKLRQGDADKVRFEKSLPDEVTE